MQVWVDPPEITRDTVVFRWTQSEPNPFQQANSFFFRYADLDLSRFSTSLFLEIFLGLQLRVFAAYGKPVEVALPEPIPRTTAAYWRAFHDADLVSLAPVADVTSHSPWASDPAQVSPRRSIGVFFGGGKDSTLATCLFSELYGPDEVVLVQYVGPLRLDAKLTERLDRRQEELMLRPARERLGVATQRAWSDYQAQFREEGYHARPHLEFYTLGGLPALLTWGVSICAFGTPRTAYQVHRNPDGTRRFRYAKSRPEMLATQTAHYQRVLGVDLTVLDINFLFTTLMDFKILAERYPHAVEQIVMCTHGEVTERWCYQCVKCAEYAFFSLACGVVDPRFDYDRFFTKSRYMQRIIEYARSGVELSVFGNAPWQPFFSVAGHYLVFCHAIAQIEPGLLAGRLSDEGFTNLITLQALFGNRRFPSTEMLPAKAIDLIGHEVARRVARLAAEHVPIVDDLPGPFLAGQEEITYDFEGVQPPRTAALDHIREAVRSRRD